MNNLICAYLNAFKQGFFSSLFVYFSSFLSHLLLFQLNLKRYNLCSSLPGLYDRSVELKELRVVSLLSGFQSHFYFIFKDDKEGGNKKEG